MGGPGTDGGLIVAPLPIAAVPNITVVAAIRVSGRQPVVESVATGGYIEATVSPKTDLDLPGRWVDWEMRVPAPAWISIAWRQDDDPLHTGARTALDQLLKDAHTEPYDGPEVDWPSWRTFAATLGDHRLTMAGLSPDLSALDLHLTRPPLLARPPGFDTIHDDSKYAGARRGGLLSSGLPVA